VLAINSIRKQLGFGIYGRVALARAVCLFTFKHVNFASGASILIRNAFQWKVFMQSFVASVNLELKCAEIALLISATWLQGLELGSEVSYKGSQNVGK
jgi:hypothetical protein